MLPENLEEIIFEAEMDPFYDYLESMERFLEIETQKHYKSLRTIEEKIRLGEITSPKDPHQMPDEMRYDYFRLDRIREFENILRKSFFISIYTFLESTLMAHCQGYLEKEKDDTLLKLSEIAGQGIHQAMTYLIKVQRINFSLDTSREWSEIRNYNRLRNCIVHNEGKLDKGYKGSFDKLTKYINRPHSTLSLGGPLGNDEIILSKEFCREVLDTIKAFLLSVLFAST